MQNTLWGLNYWAYTGFIFLILAGFCSAMASKTSTTAIVSKGVDDVLTGTAYQIDDATQKINHPVHSLHLFLINEHNRVNDLLIEKIIEHSMIDFALKNYDDSNGTDVRTMSTFKYNNGKLMEEIKVLNTEFQSSINTIKHFIEEIKDPSIASLFKVYHSSFNDLLKNYRNTGKPKSQMSIVREKKADVIEVYEFFLSKVRKNKQNPLSVRK